MNKRRRGEENYFCYLNCVSITYSAVCISANSLLHNPFLGPLPVWHKVFDIFIFHNLSFTSSGYEVWFDLHFVQNFSGFDIQFHKYSLEAHLTMFFVAKIHHRGVYGISIPPIDWLFTGLYPWEHYLWFACSKIQIFDTYMMLLLQSPEGVSNACKNLV